MRDLIARTVLLGLAGLFAWAATSKLARPREFRDDLERYRLPRPVRVAAFLVVPWAEVLVVGLLVTTATRTGAVVAIALLAVFCGAVVRARVVARENKLGCGCFGHSPRRDYRVLLLRNLSLAAAAAFVLQAGVGLWSDGRGPLVSADALPVAAVVLAGASAWAAWQTNLYLRREHAR